MYHTHPALKHKRSLKIPKSTQHCLFCPTWLTGSNPFYWTEHLQGRLLTLCLGCWFSSQHFCLSPVESSQHLSTSVTLVYHPVPCFFVLSLSCPLVFVPIVSFVTFTVVPVNVKDDWTHPLQWPRRELSWLHWMIHIMIMFSRQY